MSIILKFFYRSIGHPKHTLKLLPLSCKPARMQPSNPASRAGQQGCQPDSPLKPSEAVQLPTLLKDFT